IGLIKTKAKEMPFLRILHYISKSPFRKSKTTKLTTKLQYSSGTMIKSTPCIAAIGIMAVMSLMGCSKKEYQSFEELDNANIRAYIQQNNLTVHQYKETDLFYQVLEEGTGNPIDYTEVYPIVYTVKSLDGTYNSNDT